MASKFWDFDKKTQTFNTNEENSSKNEQEIQFKLTRYKDDITFLEELHIECIIKGISNHIIVTSLLDLDKDMNVFLNYGAALNPVKYASLQQEIRNIYLDLDIESSVVDSSKDILLEEIIKIIEEYIEDIKLEARDNCFNIPVKEFDTLFSEGKYKDFAPEEIRNLLSKNGFTKCSTGRTTRTINIDGKVTRVVSFLAKKVELKIS